jgi:hypothetical protein
VTRQKRNWPNTGNPDVDELLLRNQETCDHPDRAIVRTAKAVGSGLPGVIGCHMVSVEVCKLCGEEVTGVRLARYLDSQLGKPLEEVVDGVARMLDS